MAQDNTAGLGTMLSFLGQGADAGDVSPAQVQMPQIQLPEINLPNQQRQGSGVLGSLLGNLATAYVGNKLQTHMDNQTAKEQGAALGPVIDEQIAGMDKNNPFRAALSSTRKLVTSGSPNTVKFGMKRYDDISKAIMVSSNPEMKNHLQVVNDEKGNSYYVDTASGGAAVPIMGPNGGQIRSPQYFAPAISERTTAEQTPQIIQTTDAQGHPIYVTKGQASGIVPGQPQGQPQQPQASSDIVGIADHTMNHGIIPVESGGEKDPLNASNPNSSANGPSQVLEGSGKDFGFGMPPYPKGGTLAQKKAWSTIAYAHLVDHYNGNTDKATQAWHDGVGAVDKGAPDSTGYVNKVNANLGQPQAPMHGQSPTEQAAATAEALLPYKQQEQLNQANINVQTEDIKNKNKIQTDLTKTNLEQQAAATSPERVKGRTEFSKLLTDLNGYYNELDKINGAHNSNKGVISNTAASFNTSELGQKLGRAVGSRDQVLRDKIETAKTTLMPLAMKATGMVSQQLNSEMELQNFLKTLTDPSVDVSVAKEQIKRLENLHGVSSVNGAEPSTSKEPTHPGYTGREQMKGGVKYKLRNDGKWEK